MKFLVLISFILLFIGCEEQELENFETSERLNASLSHYATRQDANTIYCSVRFHEPDDLSLTYELEEGSIVACDGYRMVKTSNYYYTYVPRTTSEPAMLSITRPKAGTSFIRYINLQ